MRQRQRQRQHELVDDVHICRLRVELLQLGPDDDAGSGGSSSAEEAVLAYIDAASKDQWGRVWDGSTPDQKALFTREAFIECGAAPPFTVDDVDVVETYEENISLPGVSDSVPTAVTLEITVVSGGEQDTQTITAHGYEVDGQWWSSVDKDKVAACT